VERTLELGFAQRLGHQRREGPLVDQRLQIGVVDDIGQLAAT